VPLASALALVAAEFGVAVVSEPPQKKPAKNVIFRDLTSIRVFVVIKMGRRQGARRGAYLAHSKREGQGLFSQVEHPDQANDDEINSHDIVEQARHDQD
jgi:hypothetical protein